MYEAPCYFIYYLFAPPFLLSCLITKETGRREPVRRWLRSEKSNSYLFVLYCPERKDLLQCCTSIKREKGRAALTLESAAVYWRSYWCMHCSNRNPFCQHTLAHTEFYGRTDGRTDRQAKGDRVRAKERKRTRPRILCSIRASLENRLLVGTTFTVVRSLPRTPPCFVLFFFPFFSIYFFRFHFLLANKLYGLPLLLLLQLTPHHCLPVVRDWTLHIFYNPTGEICFRVCVCP